MTSAAATRLAPVLVDPSRVRRVTVGLRPFRPSGFAVRAEQRGSTLLVHNYGHGGCGISLSWGTARMAADLTTTTAPSDAIVLGCGAVGLATARVLQQRGIRVLIQAAALPTSTTSSVAGAFWAPFSLFDADRQTPELLSCVGTAARESHRIFRELSNDPRYGIHRLPLYYLDHEPPVLSAEMSAAPELFDGPLLAPGDHPFGDRYAVRMRGMAIEPGRYLATLLEDFLGGGGSIIRRELKSLTEVDSLSAPVIVNCTGLGARTLCDPELVPVRGQLVYLEPQDDIDYMVVAPREGLYMLPRRDAIILGASHCRDSWSLAPSGDETTELLAAHAALFKQ